jgi:hypothetical protein
LSKVNVNIEGNVSDEVLNSEASAFLDSPDAARLVLSKENFDRLGAVMEKHRIAPTREGYRQGMLLAIDQNAIDLKPGPAEIAVAQAAAVAAAAQAAVDLAAAEKAEAEALLAEFYSKSNARSSQGPSEVQRWLKINGHQAKVDAAIAKYGATRPLTSMGRVDSTSVPGEGRGSYNKEIRSDATTAEARAIRDVQEGMRNLHVYLNTPDKVTEKAAVPLPSLELGDDSPVVQEFFQKATSKQIQSFDNARRRFRNGQ